MRYLVILLLTPLFFACSKKAETVSTAEVYPSVVEIISPDSVISNEGVLAVCQEFSIPHSAVYQWNNHLAIYHVIDSVSVINDKLKEQYPDAEIKLYETPFYIFDRKGCDNKETAEEWNNTLMTANLVESPEMQQEYMGHHVTQTEQWPEIAAGFCHANFQQLLMFRNGRQLMLIISIPQGEDLDELNPKTAENNPRVDDWNAMMSKYQEGIAGTREGDTWVVLTPLQKD